jgi:Protein of unknown function (DUF2934)
VSQPRPCHEEIELCAYRLWEVRGHPWGSPEVDWLKAEQELTTNEPEGVLSKIAREVGSVLGNAVAHVTDLSPTKRESA